MADAVMATGRRKTSIAVVKLVKGKGRIFVNGKTLREYIGNRPAVEMMLYRPLVLTENQEKYETFLRMLDEVKIEDIEKIEQEQQIINKKTLNLLLLEVLVISLDFSSFFISSLISFSFILIFSSFILDFLVSSISLSNSISSLRLIKFSFLTFFLLIFITYYLYI